MITELSRWRAQGGFTQREAAGLLGVSQTYFSLLERGVRPMTDGLRRRLGVVWADRLREQAGRGEAPALNAVEQGFSMDLQRAHALLDTLAPARLNAVRRLLEVFVDP